MSRYLLSLVWLWAAFYLAPPALAQDPSYARCVNDCHARYANTCRDANEYMSCIETHPNCVGRPDFIRAASAELINRMLAARCEAAAIEQARQPRTRRTTRRTATATTTTTSVRGPLTYHGGVLGEGSPSDDEATRRAAQLCVELGGVWYAEGTTPDPSRERIIALVQLIDGPNAGVGGSAEQDRRPGVCLTPEGVVFAEVIRAAFTEMRAGDAAAQARLAEVQAQIDALRAAMSASDSAGRERDERMLVLIEALTTRVETILRNPDTRTTGDDTDMPTPSSRDEVVVVPTGSPILAEAPVQPESQPPQEVARRHLTGERLGIRLSADYVTSRYQLVAHYGSGSPQYLGLGIGLTLRVFDHIYATGDIGFGVSLADGQHVPRLREGHYRFGGFGVLHEHLLLGVEGYFFHTYSGNGALREQDGTWFQLRRRGLMLSVGYLWRERDWSPYVTLGVGIGQGAHADRLLTNDSPNGVYRLFDPVLMISVGAMRF